MRIAFHTPLNAFADDRISGDRRMARQLAAALGRLGHSVLPVADARSYMRTPDPTLLKERLDEAAARRAALLECFSTADEAPQLWFTYHSYYKAPDLLGPEISRRLDIPYVVAEASDTKRRATGEWAEHVAIAREGFGAADLHFCFTARDRAGLRDRCGAQMAFLDLPPFIDLPPSEDERRQPESPVRLVTVAMMRPGAKFDSYRMLAEALRPLGQRDWRLTVIGDGPMRAEVEQAFAGLPDGRVDWLGSLDHAVVARALARHDLFVWPGLGEAYGLVYLEAQAAGLPVVACDSGGVAATLKPGETALLVPEGDAAALTAAIARLIDSPALCTQMGTAARSFVASERSLTRASERLAEGLALAVQAHSARHAATSAARAS